ncbi:MAG: hypothetical protein EON89_08230 [Brevundimonas sp.]|nr:MAG: hypothetical protein EON89_08230 [Brevundimonas sp.]
MTRSQTWPRTTVKLAGIGAVFGVGGYLFGKLLADLYPDLGAGLDVRWADAAAFALAAVMLVASVVTVAISTRPAALGRLLKLEGPAGPVEAREARLQAAILALSGAVLALPPLFIALGVSPLPAFAGVAALLVLHTALNLRLYRSADELFRRVVIDAGAATFWVGQGLLFLWAAAERLALAPPVTAWDVYVVLMAVYLVASMTVTIRRGLA